jgi:hypothetical protein
MAVAYHLPVSPRSEDLDFALFAGHDIRHVSQDYVVADLAAGMDGYDPETYFKHLLAHGLRSPARRA